MKKTALVYKNKPMIATSKNKPIYTISSLTTQISSLLEESFPFLWVVGEISNYTLPASGHAYFSLKDSGSIINCVMFRNQRRCIKFELENGLNVMGLARISVYAPRGTYQLIFEHLEPEGAGALSLAFEQLKKKLAKEGLFDEIHKKNIPFFPETVSVITSGTGAAVRDIIKVASRRCPCCILKIIPVKVQGDGSDKEIINALEMINEQKTSQVIIIARGGGSAEDLSAFNSESLARAIFASSIPVVTGIGHETDFTIADFVADLRTSTPSAAMSVLPDQRALSQMVQGYVIALKNALNLAIRQYKENIDTLESRLKNPSKIIHDHMLGLEDLEIRSGQALFRKIFQCRASYDSLVQRLHGAKPCMAQKKKDLHNLEKSLHQAMKGIFNQLDFQIKNLDTRLESVNPVSVLNRGYSIVRSSDKEQIITDKQQTYFNQSLEIVLAKGRISARVERSEYGKKKDV